MLLDTISGRGLQDYSSEAGGGGWGAMLPALLSGLVVLYFAVMSGVFISLCCKKPRTTAGGGAILPNVSKPSMRTITREKSWTNKDTPTGVPLSSTGFGDIDKQLRREFMRKVYGILSTQILLTTIVAGAMVALAFDGGPENMTSFGATIIGWYNTISFLLFIPIFASLFWCMAAKARAAHLQPSPRPRPLRLPRGR